jgi:HK97 family phage major capsid protein
MTQEEIQKNLDNLAEKIKGEVVSKKELETMQGEFQALSDKIEGLTEKAIDPEKVKNIELSLNDMAEKIEKNASKQSDKPNFKAEFEAQKDNLKNVLDGKNDKAMISFNRKSITASSFNDDTDSFASGEMGKENRGMEFVRNLFRVRPVGNDSHGTVTYWEQSSITNNAEAVAEGSASTTASDIEWTKYTLDAKRLRDKTKATADQLQDVTWMREQVLEMLNKNVRLVENAALLNGTGAGNFIQGISGKSTAFDSTAVETIDNANIFDLISKCKTQVAKKGLGAYVPNYVLLSPTRVEQLRTMKDSDGRYLNPTWAFGDTMNVSGMQIVENALMDDDEMYVGDFSVGTLYEWNNLDIEIGRMDDDLETGYFTMVVYLRENLLIKSTDTNAIVKVADIDTEIDNINTVSA